MDVAPALTSLGDVDTAIPAATAITTVSSVPAPTPAPLSMPAGANTRTAANSVPDIVMTSPRETHEAHSSQNNDQVSRKVSSGTAGKALDATGTTIGTGVSSTGASSTGVSLTETRPDGPSCSAESTVTDTPQEQLKLKEDRGANKNQTACEWKERVIERVLQQGKVIKMSRRLRTRLEYAVLKIRRGWSKYTLQELESLLEAPSSLLHSGSSDPLHHQGAKRERSTTPVTVTSLRQSERKRTRKAYPDYEQHSELRGGNGSARKPRGTSPYIPPTSIPGMGNTGGTGRGYTRRTRPSFSLFKDSELFLPAKSLMDIATSSPAISPATSPRLQHSHASNLAPGARSNTTVVTTQPTMQDIIEQRQRGVSRHDIGSDNEDARQEDMEGPSDTQAARTILMLAASPNGPPTRTLNARSRATTPSSPILKDEEIVGPLFSLPASRPTTTAGSAASSATGNAMGGTGLLAPSYSPMTSSPLVHFQTTAASTPSPDRSPSMSNSTVTAAIEHNVDGVGHEHNNNPFLSKKRASKPPSSSGLLYVKDATTKHGHEPTIPSSLSVSLSPAEHLAGMWDPTRVDFMDLQGSDMLPPLGLPHDSDMTIARDEGLSSSTDAEADATTIPSTPSPPLATFTIPHGLSGQNPPLEPLGIQTPPPSGGIGTGVSGKAIVQESILARRRGSGLAAGGPGMDLMTMFFPNANTSSSSGYQGGPSMTPGAGAASAIGDNGANHN